MPELSSLQFENQKSKIKNQKSTSVFLTINGTSITVPAGTTVAAAIAHSNITTFRQSIHHQPRAPLCGMGICFECRVTINGQPNLRSCSILCENGMEVRTDA